VDGISVMKKEEEWL